jgi:hypothetical protein
MCEMFSMKRGGNVISGKQLSDQEFIFRVTTRTDKQKSVFKMPSRDVN